MSHQCRQLLMTKRKENSKGITFSVATKFVLLLKFSFCPALCVHKPVPRHHPQLQTDSVPPSDHQYSYLFGKKANTKCIHYTHICDPAVLMNWVLSRLITVEMLDSKACIVFPCMSDVSMHNIVWMCVLVCLLCMCVFA